ncbi:MAG: hypothetical protein AAFR52_21215, partial [Pseudomonadota bacterium]
AQGGRLRLRRVHPIDEVVASTQGLRVYVGAAEALASVRRRLEIGARAGGQGGRRSAGPITLVVALPEMDREAEIALPGSFPTGPEIRGMLKDVAGVEAVEEA